MRDLEEMKLTRPLICKCKCCPWKPCTYHICHPVSILQSPWTQGTWKRCIDAYDIPLSLPTEPTQKPCIEHVGFAFTLAKYIASVFIPIRFQVLFAMWMLSLPPAISRSPKVRDMAWATSASVAKSTNAYRRFLWMLSNTLTPRTSPHISRPALRAALIASRPSVSPKPTMWTVWVLKVWGRHL